MHKNWGVLQTAKHNCYSAVEMNVHIFYINKYILTTSKTNRVYNAEKTEISNIKINIKSYIKIYKT